MTTSPRPRHLSVTARRCLILATLAGVLLVPALQATVGGFFITDLSAAGLVSLALICGARYLGGRSVHRHVLPARLAVCAGLLSFSVFQLLAITAARPNLSSGERALLLLTVLLLEVAIWAFTAHMTRNEHTES